MTPDDGDPPVTKGAADPAQQDLPLRPHTPRRSRAVEDSPVEIFSPGFRGEMNKQVSARVEIAATIILDGALLAVSLAVRALLLWVVAKLGPPPSGGHEPDLQDWAVRAVEAVLNFGLVGTVLVVTVFDLTKRIRMGYRGLRNK